MFRAEKEETKSKYKKYSVCVVGHIRATEIEEARLQIAESLQSVFELTAYTILII